MSVVNKFNEIRCASEGDPIMAQRLAAEAGLPPKIVEYIALSTDWRKFATAFRLLCTDVSTDETLPRFWRAAAFESLGATTPAQESDKRVYLLDSANEMVDDIGDIEGDDKLEREYIETCTAAGKNETIGQERSLNVFYTVAATMIKEGWFNAPGRLKAYLDELKQRNVDLSAGVELVTAYAQREQGPNAFSKRQTGFLKKDYGHLFPAAA